jgi:hypothetical protein
MRRQPAEAVAEAEEEEVGQENVSSLAAGSDRRAKALHKEIVRTADRHQRLHSQGKSLLSSGLPAKLCINLERKGA